MYVSRETPLIAANTRVRLRTENGGDSLCTILQPYRPTFGNWFTMNGGAPFWVEPTRLRSVYPVYDEAIHTAAMDAFDAVCDRDALDMVAASRAVDRMVLTSAPYAAAFAMVALARELVRS